MDRQLFEANDKNAKQKADMWDEKYRQNNCNNKSTADKDDNCDTYGANAHGCAFIAKDYYLKLFHDSATTTEEKEKYRKLAVKYQDLAYYYLQQVKYRWNGNINICNNPQ